MQVIKSFRMDNGSSRLCNSKTYDECVEVVLSDIGDRNYSKINDHAYAINWCRYFITDDSEEINTNNVSVEGIISDIKVKKGTTKEIIKLMNKMYPNAIIEEE